MSGLEIIPVLFVLFIVFSGPIAFIISIIISRRTERLTSRIRRLEAELEANKSDLQLPVEKPIAEPAVRPADDITQQSPGIILDTEPEPLTELSSAADEKPEPAIPVRIQPPAFTPEFLKTSRPVNIPIARFETGNTGPANAKQEMMLEQKIGTQWILIAGLITVLVGVAFFLKYAYENFVITELTRVLIVAGAGLVSLVVGEITRRRNYEIVAKGVTALGFALLYASVFAGYQLYGLLDMLPAFVLAAAITALAMIYAAVLDEVIIAFISLLGGFGTPALIIDTFSDPSQIFIYVIILSIGAVSIGAYRKWRPINILTFIGSFLLYGLWFYDSGDQYKFEQVAVLWLSIFFTIYLVMPIVYELFRKLNSKAEDVALILINSVVTFCFVCVIFDGHPKVVLAKASVILAAANLVMALIVTVRNREDINLRIVLTAIGLFFITVAVPLYFELYYLNIAWIAEGLILAVIGLSWRSKRFQAVSVVPLMLCLVDLMLDLPLHGRSFQLFANQEFGMWMLMSVSLLVYHLLFRLGKPSDESANLTLSIMTYLLFGLVFFFAVTTEWFCHCRFNIPTDNIARQYFSVGMILLALVEMYFFTVKPVSPSKIICAFFAFAAAVAGTVYSVSVLTGYYGKFMIFANLNFASAFVFVLGLLLLAWLLKVQRSDSETENLSMYLPSGLVIWAVILMLIILTEQIWVYCDRMLISGEILAGMWISVSWAVYGCVLMVLGFSLRQRNFRYIAIGLFGILLVKVFLIDTRHIQSIYRIAAFLATGVTLVGVSYLYQHLKNAGFFEKLLADNPRND